MVQFVRWYRGLRVREVFFSESSAAPPVTADVDRYFQSALPGPGAAAFVTLHIPLGEDEDALWSRINSGCRYEIRRARDKDGVACTAVSVPSAVELEQFCSFYDQFSRTRGVTAVNRPRLELLAKIGGVTLTHASMPASNILCRHCYIVDGSRARLLYSATTSRGEATNAERALLGRANRLLHWEDLRHFRRAGMRIYDFGGVSTDGATASIDKFKREFGGSEVTEYNSLLGRSLVGRLAVWAMKLRS